MFDDYDYESIDDIARADGFFIDDDGHWVPLEEALECGYDVGDIDLDDLYGGDDYDPDLDDWED